MNVLIALLFGGLILAAASYLAKVRKSGTLVSLSDEQFVRLYQRQFSDPPSSVLKLRTIVAKHLGLSSENLAPDQSFDDLAKYTGFVGEFEVGMGDLEEELLESFQRAGLRAPSTFPKTVAEFIHEMHRSHTKQSSEP